MNVIEIEDIWKEYHLGVIGHGTLTQDVQSWWARIRGKEDPNAKIANMLSGQESQIDGNRFWALQNINLEVKQGEVLGIIGKNGAGKSTLLKILSRVTAPTKGKINVKGRIASLLEVGTGFHPELTGRENVYLNGAILGMSKQEVKSKFDEIVDFAGIDTFIDTPVKRYSSGMYVRLAFAVAAHLEPEILIVDEVLAVGDADFQKKCLGKMEEVGKEGRTILFVSHNLSMISKLCPRCVLLDHGEVVIQNSTEEVLQRYMQSSTNVSSCDLSEATERQGRGGIVFNKIEFLDKSLNDLSTARCGSPLVIRLYFLNTTGKKYNAARFSINIGTLDHGLVLLDTSVSQETALVVKDHGFVEFCVERLPLTIGRYIVSIFVEANREIQDWIQNGPYLEVEDGSFFESGRNIVPGFEGKQVLVDHKVKFSWKC